MAHAFKEIHSLNESGDVWIDKCRVCASVSGLVIKWRGNKESQVKWGSIPHTQKVTELLKSDVASAMILTNDGTAE